MSIRTVSHVPVLTQVSFERNDSDGMLLPARDVAYSCCPSVSHKVAYAESVPKSDARAGRLRFLVVYSASVILDSDTHLVEIHIECQLCT